MSEPTRLLRTVGSISSATAVSRVLGLVRDQVQSYFFGVGAVTDAFSIAFRIPNLLRDLFAEGALSSAFVPTFTAEQQLHGPEAAWRLANRIIASLCVILGALTLLIFIGAPWILKVYVSGFEAEKMALAVTMTRILSPFLLAVALAAVAMGALNANGRFFVPALAPASFNISSIVLVLLLVPLLPRLGLEASLALAIGAMVGGAMQFAVQLPALRSVGFRFRLELAWKDPALRRIARLMLPATIGLAATQINILVDAILASRFGDGPVTYLALAFRLMQLPIGLFGVALGTATLARVSRDAAHRDVDSMKRNLAAALRAVSLLAIPATFGLVVLRTPICRLIHERGAFETENTDQLAATVLCYSFGLVAYAVTKIQVPTFYAIGDTRTPVLGSVCAVSIKIGASFAFIALLGSYGIEPFLGLALSTSLAAWIQFSWLGYSLRRRFGSFQGEAIFATMMKMLLVSGVMAAAVHFLHSALERQWPPQSIWIQIGEMSLSVGCGLAIVAVGTHLMRIPEARLWSRFIPGR